MVGENEQSRIDFVRAAINEHKGSNLYRTAVEAELYYDGENPTINRYEKIIYDMQGKAHRDMWTANHKIASQFYGFVVDQEISYLLANGVAFGEKRTKERLGANFDENICDLAQFARIGGVSFGFWNVDHVDMFKVTEFVPMWDEENGALMAGVRFWQLTDNKPLRATLYEPDGYTEYRWIDGEGEIYQDKRPYKLKVRQSEATGAEIYDGENYPTFPIVPLFNNRKMKSSLNGKRNTLDALDLARSGMVNNVSEGALIYWVLKDYNGMDDVDDAEFKRRLLSLGVVHVDGEGDATPHTVEAPFDGTSATIDMLLRQLYDDFQAFNSEAVTASNQSATAIKASYIPLDLKVDKIERQVTRFIKGILALAGIEDEPTYTRNQLINKQEETQSLLMAAQYYDSEYILKKLLTINGDIDQFDEISKRIMAEEMNRYAMIATDEEEQTEQTEQTTQE